MGNIEEYVKSFIKDIKKEPLRLEERRDLNNDIVFEDAVRQGYYDAARTFKGIGSHKEAKKEAFKQLANEIKKYFMDDPLKKEKDFDKFHDGCCTLFKKVLSDYGYKCTYGHAQKVVNMAFKYLYCCEGAKEREDYFLFCHMALDKYTLRWYKRYTGKKHNNWSNIERDEYLRIQKDIRDKLKDNGLTVLQNEFIIWSDERFFEAISSFSKTAKQYNYKHSNLELQKGLEEIKKTIDKIIKNLE